MPTRESIETATSVPINSRVPLDGHPDQLVAHADTLLGKGGSHGATIYSSGRGALQALYSSETAMDAAVQANLVMHQTFLAGNKNPIKAMVVPEEKKAALSNALSQAADTASIRVQRHIDAIDASVEQLTNTINAAIKNPRANETGVASAANQIRGFLQKMPAGERMPFLQEQIKAGDKEVTAAVLGTTSFVSGLTRDQQNELRDLAEKSFAPDAYQARSSARAVKSQIENASSRYIERLFKRLPHVREDKGAAATRALAGSH